MPLWRVLSVLAVAKRLRDQDHLPVSTVTDSICCEALVCFMEIMMLGARDIIITDSNLK